MQDAFLYITRTQDNNFLLIFFPELWYSPLEFNSKQFANIWRIKQEGISAIKFEAAQIHFLSDFLVAVAIFVA